MTSEGGLTRKPVRNKLDELQLLHCAFLLLTLMMAANCVNHGRNIEVELFRAFLGFATYVESTHLHIVRAQVDGRVRRSCICDSEMFRYPRVQRFHLNDNNYHCAECRYRCRSRVTAMSLENNM